MIEGSGDMDWTIAKDVGEGVCAVAVVIAVTRNRYKQRKAEREFGLKDNPKRCAEHAKAINELRDDLNELRDVDIHSIKEKLGIV